MCFSFLASLPVLLNSNDNIWTEYRRIFLGAEYFVNYNYCRWLLGYYLSFIHLGETGANQNWWIKKFVSLYIPDLHVYMPSRKTAEGEFRDIAHPITTDFRQSLQNMIFAKYREFLKEEEKSSKAKSDGKQEKTKE